MTSPALTSRLGPWAAATLAWSVFLVGHMLAVKVTPDVRSMAYVVTTAGLLSGLAGLLLAGLDRLAARLGARVSLGIFAALAAWPAYLQAAFLTSGNAIARHPQVELIRVVMFLVLWAAFVALWRGRRALLDSRRPLLVAIAGVGALLAFFAMAGRLDAYAYFGRAVTFVAWLLVATLAALPLPGRPRGERAVIVGATLAVVVAGLLLLREGGLAAVRTRLPARASALEWSQLVPSEPPSQFELDLSPAAPGECAARAAVPSPPPLPGGERRRHVILVSVDTLRADAVADMPELSAFLAGALRFRQAHTTYPATLYALGGMATGWAPHQLLLAASAPPSLFARAAALLEPALYLPDSKWFKMPAAHDLFVQGAPHRYFRDATRQTDQLLADLPGLRADGRRHFLWVHYLEPHEPWQVHPGFDSGASLRERYRSEVRYLDAELGRLFAGLAAGGWLEDSLVVFFADHGEALGEHGYKGHHVYLNGWLTHVPLALRAPGLSAGDRDDVVSLPDVAPTVAHFLDLPPPLAASGKSLFVAGGDDAASVAEAFPSRGSDLFREGSRRVRDLAELRVRAVQSGMALTYPPKSALTTRRWRYIVSRTTGSEELYDRQADPGEDVNLIDRQPEVAAELRERLSAWYHERGRDAVCDVERAQASREAPR